MNTDTAGDFGDGADDFGGGGGVPPPHLNEGSPALQGPFIPTEAATARMGTGMDEGDAPLSARSDSTQCILPDPSLPTLMDIDFDQDTGQAGGSSCSKKRKVRPDEGSSDKERDSGGHLGDSMPDADSLGRKKRKTYRNAGASEGEDGSNGSDGEFEDEDPLPGRESFARLSVDSSSEGGGNPSSDDELDKERDVRSDVGQHGGRGPSRGTTKKAKNLVRPFKPASKAKKNRKRNSIGRPMSWEAQASQLKLHKNNKRVEPGDSIWCPIHISVCISSSLYQTVLIVNMAHRKMFPSLTSL